MFGLNTFYSRIMSIGTIQRQSIVSLISQIALTFVGFLSTMYFAHAVGADALGAYFLFIAYLGIIGLMTDGGFGGAAIKRISEGEEPDAYFSAFVVLRSLFVTLVIIVLIAFRGYFVDLNNAGTFIWLLIALTASFFQGAISSGIVGSGKVGIQSTTNLIDIVSRILIQVVTVFLGYGVAGLAGGFVAGVLIGTVLQLRFFDLHFVHFGWRHLKSLSSFALWAFLISGGGMVFMYSDSVMIGYFLNNADVGIYRVIFQFTSIAAFTTIALRSTLLPRISRWDKIGEIGPIQESLSRAFTYSLLLAVPLLAGGTLLGDKLLYYFYGKDFVHHATLITLYIVQIVNVFHYLFATYLNAMNRIKEVFKITAVAVVANIALNAILIPVMGIWGAAVATLVTMMVNAILAGGVISRYISIQLEHNSLLNILKATTVMSLVVGGYRLVVPLTSVWLALIAVIVGGSIYGVLILKYDRKIYDELKGILMQMNIGWPGWM